MMELHADQYVKTLANEYGREFAFAARSQRETMAWQTAFRVKLEDALGIRTIAGRGISDLAPMCLGKETFADHVREEWFITSEPGYQVPFYLLRPLAQDGPRPVVITPHGHGKAGKATYVGIANTPAEAAQIDEGERDIALQAVRQGYIAIAPDMRGFASTRLSQDVAKDRTSSCRTMQMHALLFGRTLVGERVWDMRRLVDFVESQESMDAQHIVMTGNSGGGTVTLFAGALDPRIGIVIPSCYFSTFVGSIGAVEHCECNYVPGMLQLGEMADVAGLVAPRPFLAVAGREDPIFPLAAVKEGFEHLQHIYQTVGRPERCELYVGDEGHRYYKARVWPFVQEWLRPSLPRR